MSDVPGGGPSGDAVHGNRAGFLCRLWTTDVCLQSVRPHGHRENCQVGGTMEYRENEITILVFIVLLAGTGPRWIFRMEQTVSRRCVRSVRRQSWDRPGTLG